MDDQLTLKQLDMTKMVCQKCYFIYNPKYGDEESNIDPLTPFKDIPDTWTCPICNNPKDQFIEYNPEDIHIIPPR